MIEGWANHTFQGIPQEFPDQSTFIIRRKDLMYPCVFRRCAAADRLVVFLRGAPGVAFKRRVSPGTSLAAQADAHLLIVFDPSLLLDPDLRTGVFLGERENDPIDGVVEISQALADNIGVAPGRIVFFGGSGGGFAA